MIAPSVCLISSVMNMHTLQCLKQSSIFIALSTCKFYFHHTIRSIVPTHKLLDVASFIYDIFKKQPPTKTQDSYF